MPSEPDDTSWGFGPALDLIGSLNSFDASPSPTMISPESTTDVELDKPTIKEADTELSTSSGLQKLGDFGKIYDLLGIPKHARTVTVYPEDFDTDASYNSDEALASPPLELIGVPKNVEAKIEVEIETEVEVQVGTESLPKVEIEAEGEIETEVESDISDGEDKPAESPNKVLTKKQARQGKKRQRKEAKSLAKAQRVHEMQVKNPVAQENPRQHSPKKAQLKIQENDRANGSPKQTMNKHVRSQNDSPLLPRSLSVKQLRKATAAKAKLSQKNAGPVPSPNQPTSFAIDIPSLPAEGMLSGATLGFVPQESSLSLQYLMLDPHAVPFHIDTPMGTYMQQLPSIPLTPGYEHGYSFSPIPLCQNGAQMHSISVQPTYVTSQVHQFPQTSTPASSSNDPTARVAPAHPRYTLRSNSSANKIQSTTNNQLKATNSTLPPVLPTVPIGYTLNPRRGEDRHEHFFLKLLRNFPEDKKWMVAPMQLSNNGTFPGGIHVIVDASNILLGFQETLRPFKERLKKRDLRCMDISFDALILLMERRRPVAKRILAGSTKTSPPLPAFQTAKAVGYEVNIMERVYKTKEVTDRDRFFMDVNAKGWDAAIKQRRSNGDDSDSETGAFTATPQTIQKWVEQGVDELLHLKMLESVCDCWATPSTMVIATGDAAPAEYSGGFMAQMERVMERGWKVELVSWKKQTSAAYRKKKFQAKWKDQFRIIELDEYLEELLDI
ncbi:uncharacterized protein BDR25DRAFT_299660 [Lindgomyces ingoldianus]|uniref:Uncharacterized protein n=1 Tax=Lindgomyces ingoldianus TaxID=673940 RepID=A0ACB6RFK8_9PLEO|nr:uncharacterized protein BDR25DRAFT_299660 [Lindgomyces ingoldianus]KAF2477911.1 hypothetical protein BDR25DRAFT_299660 [Lindgomyces ingoldianus]